jgi:Na+/proline symporter
VLISIGTAYLCFAFSNILEYLQVLVLLFIVPLFGTVIMGMLWKRATPAAGFVGFLSAILASCVMWAYVHTFPDGWKASPKATISQGASVTLTKDTAGKLTQVTVESGQVDLLNVPGAEADLEIPGKVGDQPVQLLAADVTLSGTKETTSFGVEGVPVILKGAGKTSKTISKKFAPSAFNPDHAAVIARSRRASGMAINMYSAWWSLMVSIIVTVAVSLVTKPKPDAELKNLVLGLTPLPDEGPCPWYRSPLFWAVAVLVVLVAVNIIFW